MPDTSDFGPEWEAMKRELLATAPPLTTAMRAELLVLMRPTHLPPI